MRFDNMRGTVLHLYIQSTVSRKSLLVASHMAVAATRFSSLSLAIGLPGLVCAYPVGCLHGFQIFRNLENRN